MHARTRPGTVETLSMFLCRLALACAPLWKRIILRARTTIVLHMHTQHIHTHMREREDTRVLDRERTREYTTAFVCCVD